MYKKTNICVKKRTHLLDGRIKSVPKAKILFLSSNSDADVVRCALRAGGHGYVLKWEAGIALLPAMQAVLLGKQFVSIGLMAIDGLTDLQE